MDGHRSADQNHIFLCDVDFLENDQFGIFFFDGTVGKFPHLLFLRQRFYWEDEFWGKVVTEPPKLKDSD